MLLFLFFVVFFFQVSGFSCGKLSLRGGGGAPIFCFVEPAMYVEPVVLGLGRVWAGLSEGLKVMISAILSCSCEYHW